MDKQHLLLGIQSLIEETYNKPGHYIWLNGQLIMLLEFAKITSDNPKDIVSNWIKAKAEVKLRTLAAEFENYKNSRATYETFAG